jgi:3-isopropylmalate/(R)-2-methylmalate dehydratase small subunit
VKIRSKVFVIPNENVDTDQIIPARFLKVTDKTGLGSHAFADWNPRPDPAGAAILVAGHNFGCGSSREHAPWALLGAGFRAVVSTQIADIFTNNALKNGLLPITVDQTMQAHLAADRGEVTIDLALQRIASSDGRSATFAIDPFAKHCLLNGVDQLGFLLAESDAIGRYESAHAARIMTTSTV